MVLKSGDQITFIFTPGSKLRQAFLVGDFNEWDCTADPMQPMPDGSFRTTSRLEPGRYEYKFYADGIFWDDADAENQILNCYGTLNSVVSINGDRA